MQEGDWQVGTPAVHLALSFLDQMEVREAKSSCRALWVASRESLQIPNKTQDVLAYPCQHKASHRVRTP